LLLRQVSIVDNMRFVFLALLIFSLIATGVSQNIKIKEPIHFLALGDSYTIGQSVSTTENWPTQFSLALNYKGFNIQETKIIAQTGWRTDDLKNAISQQQPLNGYNLVSLLIGVNNQFQGGNSQTYLQEFEELLITAIQLAGKSPGHVFVLSIPDYAYTPFGNGNKVISSQIDQYNVINRQIAENYQVKYIDITPISRNGLVQPDLVALDGLHPSGKMYSLWVQEIMKNVEKEVGINEDLPARDVFRYTLNHRILIIESPERDVELLVYNPEGKGVQNRVLLKEAETKVNLGELPAGMYFLIFQKKGKVLFREKIILM
jgi:lysophospholipase L1-like esterase